MGRFFDLFPKVNYTFSQSKYPEYQLITNILFRTGIIRRILYNTSAYVKYTIKESDTPETLADKVYNDPRAYWIILYANDMLDPQYDWPLSSVPFNNYIVDKYRAMAEDDEGRSLEDYEVIAWTQNLTNPAAVHHYEKVIRQENRTIDTVNEFRYKIDEDKLTDNNLTVPYAYYEGLADEQSVTAISLEVNGQTVIQTEYRNFVTYYDYEMEKNEAKREIKIIKKEYYPQIIREFESLTNVSPPAFFRRVS
jgi:hypothetical protein